MVDEIKERPVRPVEIFEDQHERALLRHRLEKPSPRGKALIASLGAELLVTS